MRQKIKCLADKALPFFWRKSIRRSRPVGWLRKIKVGLLRQQSNECDKAFNFTVYPDWLVKDQPFLFGSPILQEAHERVIASLYVPQFFIFIFLNLHYTWETCFYTSELRAIRDVCLCSRANWMDGKWQWEVAEPPAGSLSSLRNPRTGLNAKQVGPSFSICNIIQQLPNLTASIQHESHKSNSVTVTLGNVRDNDEDRLILKIFLNKFWSNHFFF